MTKMESLDRQLLNLFTQEVKERVAEFESTLLALEGTDAPKEKRNLQERILRIAHSLKGAAGLVEVRPIESLCHAMEDLLMLAAEEEHPLGAVELDLLFKATDAVSMVGRMLENNEVVSDNISQDLLRQLKARRKLRAARDAGGKTPNSRAVEPTVPSMRASDTDGSLRVAADRLDSLLHRSGELVVHDSRLRLRSREAAFLSERARSLRSGEPVAAEEAAEIEHGLRELVSCLAEDARLLHGSVVALDHEIRLARMQPFSQVCQGLHRMVRDIALTTGVAAELRVVGGDIEIDRSILVKLQDSLRHLVRNAVGHGIEMPEDRRAAGKPVTGRITVSAAVLGDRLKVRVEDDGRGLDINSIRHAATGIGLPETNDETQFLRQIFEAGVSTSAQVTSLSGRGIGLDIVRSAVESMRGMVEVSHAPGEGTAFTLTMPLTLATVRALEVHAGGQVFAIDTASIRRVLRVPLSDLPAAGEPNVIQAHEGSFRVINLASWLGLASKADAFAAFVPAVVIGPRGGETAVMVDAVAGEQELLVRSLGVRLADLRCYSGGTVLSGGRIALLLNSAVLAEAAAMEGASQGYAFMKEAIVPKRRRVLVVDDSPWIRTLEKRILETAGYEVTLACDGSEAWEHLQTHGADLVVADVDMPTMDGIMLTQAIRGSARFGNMPVILVTGRGTAEDREKGLHSGANAYVAKSEFDQQNFLETVRRVG